MSKMSIKWEDMDFGTPSLSLCGICRVEEEGYWKGDILQEDIICSECREKYEYDPEENQYVPKMPINIS